MIAADGLLARACAVAVAQTAAADAAFAAAEASGMVAVEVQVRWKPTKKTHNKPCRSTKRGFLR